MRQRERYRDIKLIIDKRNKAMVGKIQKRKKTDKINNEYTQTMIKHTHTGIERERDGGGESEGGEGEKESERGGRGERERET